MTLWLGGKQRQSQFERRTLTGGALNPNRPAMRFGDPARNGQTQSHPAKFSRACFVGAIETIKDVGQVFGGNSNSSVSKFR